MAHVTRRSRFGTNRTLDDQTLSKRPRSPARPLPLAARAGRAARRGGVRLDLQRPRVAARSTSSALTKRSPQVDVGEQPVVDVTPLAVELEADRLALEQPVVELRRLGPEALRPARPGLTVSGVSTPISRTSSSAPPTSTSIVSPSTTRRPRRDSSVGSGRGDRARSRRPPSSSPPTSRIASRTSSSAIAPRGPAARRHAALPASRGRGRRCESMISLICSTISTASFHSRCQTLRP